MSKQRLCFFMICGMDGMAKRERDGGEGQCFLICRRD